VTWNAQSRRRWSGGLCLAAAASLSLAGATVLEPRLRGWGAVVYWLACFMFLALAIGIAVLDARAVFRQSRNEQQLLFENTLRAIASEKRSRRSDGAKNRAP
jgi:hypothetical protein